MNLCRAALAAAGLAAGLLIVEGVIALSDLDIRLLRPFLYMVEGDFQYEDGREVYRASENPERLFELIPGAKAVCLNCIHPKEKKYAKTDIHINSLGMRGPEAGPEKKPGVFRIIVLGGSNTYGATVSDNDAYPAQLQKELDTLAPGTFEVWNAGLNAYTMSQKIAYARRIRKDFLPDLLIFQHNNFGRRAFYYRDKDVGKHFEKNQDLYAENIPRLAPMPLNSAARHNKALRLFGLYRVFHTAANRLLVDDPEKRASPETFGKINAAGDRISDRVLSSFLSESPRPPVMIFDPVDRRFCLNSGPHIAGVSYFSLCDHPGESEYRDIHPPSYVYSWYARRLAQRILSENFGARYVPLEKLKDGAEIPGYALKTQDSRLLGATIVARLRKKRQDPGAPAPEMDFKDESRLLLQFADSRAAAIARDCFLNQHQTGRSGGVFDPVRRAKREDVLAGLIVEKTYGAKKDNPAHWLRPVYAYLKPGKARKPEDAGRLYKRYGNVFAVLKNYVKNRTTFTAGDSLMIQDADKEVRPLDFKTKDRPELGEYADFWEAQIWGKLCFNDVEYFVADCPSLAPLSEEGLKGLKETGIGVFNCEEAKRNGLLTDVRKKNRR
jgi:hypothetical protein